VQKQRESRVRQPKPAGQSEESRKETPGRTLSRLFAAWRWIDFQINWRLLPIFSAEPAQFPTEVLLQWYRVSD
jgi:hypothetical protein